MRYASTLTSAALVAILLLCGPPADACTILSLVKDEVVLVGSNEDFTDPFTAIEFIPASEDEHGRVYFGFALRKGQVAPTGGVNEHGLFIDGNGIGATGWQPDEGKEDFKGNVEEYVLANHATVAEALEWFKAVNVYILSRGKFLLADKTGASAVVEWSDGQLRIIRRNGDYQLSTNFRQSDYPTGDYPCYRYRTAEEMLGNARDYSVELIRDVLSETHFEGATMTLFSYVGNLSTGDVYLYNFHDFNQVVHFNLREELAKGSHEQFIPALFPRISYAQHLYVPRTLAARIRQQFEQRGLDATIGRLKEVRELCLAVYDRDYTESIVNSLGYDLLASNRTGDAITVFRLNAEQHPDSANTYDSLGEAYMENGDLELAVRNYRKSLELDPNNGNATERLERLAEMKKQQASASP